MMAAGFPPPPPPPNNPGGDLPQGPPPPNDIGSTTDTDGSGDEQDPKDTIIAQLKRNVRSLKQKCTNMEKTIKAKDNLIWKVRSMRREDQSKFKEKITEMKLQVTATKTRAAQQHETRGAIRNAARKEFQAQTEEARENSRRLANSLRDLEREHRRTETALRNASSQISHSRGAVETARNMAQAAIQQRNEAQALHQASAREVKKLKKDLESASASKIEKEIELEQARAERKKIETEQLCIKDHSKVAEIKAAEQSKLNVMIQNAEIRRREIEQKQKAKREAERKKAADDTQKFQNSVAMFHGSLQNSLPGGGVFPNAARMYQMFTGVQPGQQQAIVSNNAANTDQPPAGTATSNLFAVGTGEQAISTGTENPLTTPTNTVASRPTWYDLSGAEPAPLEEPTSVRATQQRMMEFLREPEPPQGFRISPSGMRLPPGVSSTIDPISGNEIYVVIDEMTQRRVIFLSYESLFEKPPSLPRGRASSNAVGETSAAAGRDNSSASGGTVSNGLDQQAALPNAQNEPMSQLSDLTQPPLSGDRDSSAQDMSQGEGTGPPNRGASHGANYSNPPQ